METNTVETAPQSQAESFSAVVMQSQAALAEEATSQISRGRGRPPGSKNVKGRENENPESNPEINPQKINDNHASNLPPIDLKPVLKDFTKIPFSVAAIKFKNPALEIDEKDAETPAFYLDRLLNLYLPDLEKKDPKGFTFAAWLASMAIVAIKKIMIGLEKKKTVQAPQALQDGQNNNPVPEYEAPLINLPPGRNASEFFGRG